jgi:hypothetical protein
MHFKGELFINGKQPEVNVIHRIDEKTGIDQGPIEIGKYIGDRGEI